MRYLNFERQKHTLLLLFSVLIVLLSMFAVSRVGTRFGYEIVSKRSFFSNNIRQFLIYPHKNFSTSSWGWGSSSSSTSSGFLGHSSYSSSSSPASSLVSSDYYIAVSYNPKQRKPEPLDPVKYPAGEDSFINSKRLDGSVILGVADGVGGWSQYKGYNSADLSNELCDSISTEFLKNINDTEIDLIKLLEAGYKDVVYNKKVFVGGTTVCFGVVDPNSSKIHVLNLGDSWAGHFRDSKCINQTKIQTKAFNTPFQLSVIPQKMLDEAKKQNRRYILNQPKDSDIYTWDLQKNDIVIFATDGVVDNVIYEDLEIFLKDEIKDEKTDLQKVANKLVNGVYKLSINTNYPSPFSLEMNNATGQNWTGGKPDDITIAMLQVK